MLRPYQVGGLKRDGARERSRVFVVFRSPVRESDPTDNELLRYRPSTATRSIALLVAQALIEDLAILTGDRTFRLYEGRVIEA